MNHKVTGKAESIPKGIVLGMLVSMVTTVVLSGVIGWLVHMEKLQPENMGYGIMILLMASSFFGAYMACVKIKRRKLMVSIVSGFAYFVSLLSVTALFFGGQYQSVGETFLMVLCGSLLCAMWTSRSGRQKTHYRKRVGAL